MRFKVAFKRIVLAAALLTALASCAGMDGFVSGFDVTKQTVQSFETTTTKLKSNVVYNEVTSTLVDQGFDIKTSNKDIGLVTTEYKKFASYAAPGGPPFDYYLQVKATIRDAGGGKTLIRLSPIVKEQNRLNAAAFTEHELYYFEGSPENVRMADKGGWVGSGQTMFVNVAADIARKAGVEVKDMTRNVTSTKYNLLLRQ